MTIQDAIWLPLSFAAGVAVARMLRSATSEVTLTEEVEVSTHRHKHEVTAPTLDLALEGLRRLQGSGEFTA